MQIIDKYIIVRDRSRKAMKQDGKFQEFSVMEEYKLFDREEAEKKIEELTRIRKTLGVEDHRYSARQVECITDVYGFQRYKLSNQEKKEVDDFINATKPETIEYVSNLDYLTIGKVSEKQKRMSGYFGKYYFI